MNENAELELLLSLDGARYEAAEGYVVEFKVQKTNPTPSRPHGIIYAFVFRPDGGIPLVRFDNAHGVQRMGGKYVKAPVAYDHWHQTDDDKGRPYIFTSAVQLLDDFWREVKRTMNERGIPNDL